MSRVDGRRPVMTAPDAQEEFVTIETASVLVGLSPARIQHYIRAGLVTPPRSVGRRPVLGAPELARLRRIRRLATDLGLNAAGIEVALHLLDIIAALQEEAPRRRRR
jgi:DNA-binding transcriptional MerR regulator